MEQAKVNSIDKPAPPTGSVPSLKRLAPKPAFSEAKLDRTDPRPIRLRKAIMRTGEFQTPDGARFTIDKTRLDHWVRTFCRMHQNGDVCRIVKDHDEATTSSVGKVVSLLTTF